MQKTDPIREHAHAEAAASVAPTRTPALERLKARSIGKQPRPTAGVPRLVPQPGPKAKPIVW